MKTFILLALLSALMLANLVSAKEETKPRQIVLSEENTLVLDQEFDGASVSALIESARQLDSKLESKQPLYLFLYTPGGSIQDGLELYEALKGLNRPVHTITLFAASMGFQTVQQLGERYILENGVLMSHKARGGFTGEFSDGQSQLDARYSLWLSIIKEMDDQTVKRTGGKQTLKTYRAHYENEMWLLGKQAVAQGYADAVVTVKCDATLQGKRGITVKFFGMSFDILLSKCPTNTNVLGVQANVSTTRGEVSLVKFLSSGGQFGQKCYDNHLEKTGDSSYYGYYGYGQTTSTTGGNQSPTNASEGDNSVNCMLDTEVTLSKIKEQTQKLKEDRSKNISDRIVKSY